MRIQDLNFIKDVINITQVFGAGKTVADVSTDAGPGYSIADADAYANGEYTTTYTKTYARTSPTRSVGHGRAIAKSGDKGDYTFSRAIGHSSYYQAGSVTSSNSFKSSIGG